MRNSNDSARERPMPGIYVVHHRDHPPCLFAGTQWGEAQDARTERGDGYEVSLYLDFAPSGRVTCSRHGPTVRVTYDAGAACPLCEAQEQIRQIKEVCHQEHVPGKDDDIVAQVQLMVRVLAAVWTGLGRMVEERWRDHE